MGKRTSAATAPVLTVSEPIADTSLTAVNLKNQLWETLQGVRDGSIAPGSADSIASQAREILRTVRTQLSIFDQASICVSEELIDFAKPTRKPEQR